MVRTDFQATLVLAALILLAPVPGARGEDAIQWDRYSGEETVKAVTTNQDGSTRETKCWLAVVGGQGFIRTGATRWGGNIERNPEIALRIGETELLLRVELVTDPAARDAVKAAYRAKYGFSDWILNPLRGSNPRSCASSRASRSRASSRLGLQGPRRALFAEESCKFW
jgi:hypothetical protein